MPGVCSLNHLSRTVRIFLCPARARSAGISASPRSCATAGWVSSPWQAFSPSRRCGILGERPPPAAIGDREHKGQRRVVEREGRGPRDRPRHVGDAVMDHPLLDKSRVGVGRRTAGLDAAALIDRDVDDHRTRLHRPHHFASHQLRRRRARHQHRADHQVGRDDLCSIVRQSKTACAAASRTACRLDRAAAASGR